MAELSRVEFEVAAEKLRSRLEFAASEVIRDLGSNYDSAAMRRQTSQCMDTAVRELLMFGGDLWPSMSEGSPPSERQDSNVVPFARRAADALRKAGTNVGSAVKIAASVIGAVAGSTLIAAATTDYVEFPGLRAVTHHVYLHNPAMDFVRYVEINGQFVRIEGMRRPGEPGAVMHVRTIRPVSEAVAMGRADDVTPENDVAGGAILQDDGNLLTPNIGSAGRG